jgi:hypothetical protein
MTPANPRPHLAAWPTLCRDWELLPPCSAWSLPWARSAARRRKSVTKVAAALVGTFLGILLCYGLVGPVAASMTKIAEDEHAFLYVLRVLMVSFLKGTAPIMAVEVARRAVPGHVRPSFKELEQACRNRATEEAPAAAVAQ